MVYNPTKKLDNAAREKLVEEMVARMKANNRAGREREAEQRRKALAPHWDDPSDDESSSGVSMDMSSPKSGEVEQRAIPAAFSAPNVKSKGTAPTNSKNMAFFLPSSTSKALATANKPMLNFDYKLQNNISKWSVDIKWKRSYDAMSDSSSRASRDGSPLVEQPSYVTSTASVMSPKDISVGLASLPRINKRRKTSVSDQVSSISAGNATSGQNLGAAPLPEWYLTATMPKSLSPNALSTYRKLWDQFDRFKKDIKICVTTQDPQARAEAIHKVSELLHALEFTKIPHPSTLSKYKMLHDGQGLKRIADFYDSASAFNFPWYLRADAQELYNKWLGKQWDPDMFRGIMNIVKGPDRSKGQSIDPKEKKDWRFFGEGHFVAGQWWPMQLCAIRDGAHGSAQAGIAGIKQTENRAGGATSIVLSEGHKEDIDEGLEIWYCGTEARIGDTEPTASTKLMLESVSSSHPVRVMRSSSLPAGNKYKPVKGFRYDGLYEVLESKLIDKLKHHYLFHLRRIPGQINLRCEGEAARPTPRELQEYESEMKKYGRRGSFD